MWMCQLRARCERQQKTHKHFVAQVPRAFAISKMFCKEPHDILVIQGIQLLDRVCECIHHPVHLLRFYAVIDVWPWFISTSNQALIIPFQRQQNCSREEEKRG